MHRPRYLWYVLTPLLFVLAATAIGCSSAAEEPLVRKFFQASRMGDNMTLANIATVSFDPAKDGRAENVSVVEVGPEQSRTLNFKELEQARKDAVAAEDEFTKKKKEYQDKNLDAINRVLKAEAANLTLKGKDAEVQTAWTKWRDETKDYAKKVSEARAKLNAERGVADLSVPDKDATAFDAVEYTKDVKVSAKVITPNGQSSTKQYLLKLQRVVLKGEDGKPIEGRLMITGIKEITGQTS
jgi:Skp family chaperone for outer membrane proteins